MLKFIVSALDTPNTGTVCEADDLGLPHLAGVGARVFTDQLITRSEATLHLLWQGHRLLGNGTSYRVTSYHDDEPVATFIMHVPDSSPP